MAMFKISYDFEALGDQDAGWSENYWLSTTNISQAIITGLAGGNFRTGCLSGTVNMPWMRVSAFPAGAGLAAVINLSKIRSQNVYGQLAGPADFQTVKGLLRLVGTTGQYTRQWLGGIPGYNFGNNGSLQPSSSFKPALNTWLQWLAANGFCIRKVQQGTAPYPLGGTYQKWPIAGIQVGGLVTVTGNNFGVPALISIGRTPANAGFRGKWLVTANDGNNLTLQGAPKPAAALAVAKSAYAQLFAYVFPAIAANPTTGTPTQLLSVLTRSAKHSVGRPSLLPTGRRKRRVT